MIQIKENIYASINERQDWPQLADDNKEKHVHKLSQTLVEFLTKLTDYLANLKYPLKDMAIVREYLEVFKWDIIGVDNKQLLGKSAGLLTACFETNSKFWTKLKTSHTLLLTKYPINSHMNLLQT